MSTELILFLIALVPIAFRVWRGWTLGATFEVRQVLGLLFATLVALRFWHPLTEMATKVFTVDPTYLAAAAFTTLFVVAWIIASRVVNLKGEVFQSVQPNPLDNALGAASGLISGALLGGAFLVIAAMVIPANEKDFDPLNYPARLDQLPLTAFRLIEQNVAKVPTESLARTPLPVLKKDESSPEKPPTLRWE